MKRASVSGRAAVVGYTAVILLMSAGAAAGLAGANTVYSDDIVDGQVAYSDIRDNAMTGKKILDNSVLSADIRDGDIARRDIGFNVIAGVTKVSQIHQVAAGQTGSFTAVCPAEAPVVLGGGYEWSTSTGFSASTSEPWYVDGQPNGWLVGGTNGLPQTKNVYVIAICASDGSSG